MYSKLALVTAATALSLIPSAIAQDYGSASIENKCSFPAYIWSTAESSDKMVTLKPGESYQEDYRSRKDNQGGVSIKMSDKEDKGEISQFEYTITDDQVFYDLSNIDGYPFKEGGISITPSDSSCPSISCDAGVANCHEAYNQPYDDHATKGCAASADLHMTLCGSGGGSKAKKEPTYVRGSDKRSRRHARAFEA